MSLPKTTKSQVTVTRRLVAAGVVIAALCPLFLITAASFLGTNVAVVLYSTIATGINAVALKAMPA